MNEEDVSEKKRKSDPPPKKRRPKKIIIPRRKASVVEPEKPRLNITLSISNAPHAIEEPYSKPKKLNPCQHSPLTLYELAAAIVDQLPFPKAFDWSVEEVAEWMATEVMLPQYKECILDNHINGMRLLMLERPWHMPYINIYNFEHIKIITWHVHKLFSTEFIKFARSIGLTPRKPLTHCTWFKSRTGPNWGIRKNWTRCDLLRWMKVLMPAPVYLDHWDLVWYHKPEYPKLMFARIPKHISEVYIPKYIPHKEVCVEYMVPRKFRIQTSIPDEAQMIWMEHIKPEKIKKKMKIVKPVTKECRLMPKKISLTGLAGRDLILARRKMPKTKFLG